MKEHKTINFRANSFNLISLSFREFRISMFFKEIKVKEVNFKVVNQVLLRFIMTRF